MGLINSFSRLFRKKMDTDELMFNFLVIASSIIAQKDAWEYKTLAISFAQYIDNSQYKIDYEQADLVSKTARFICTYDELQKLLIDFNKSNLDISYYFQILDLLNALRSGILTELEFDSEDIDGMNEAIATLNEEFQTSHDKHSKITTFNASTLGSEDKDDELALYGITFDGEKYHFQTYMYDNRDDAVRYAELVTRNGL
jgi:hypothetical protein